jgi:ribosomal protein S12 methylthiotransferase
LIAQDSTYYGLDIYKDRKLAELLQRLSEVEGIGWIRLHYAFPSGFPEDVLDVMRETENICKYIDIPLQHISDNMLKSMRRGTTEAKTYELIDMFRDESAGHCITHHAHCWLPGETEEDHHAMLRFVEKAAIRSL